MPVYTCPECSTKLKRAEPLPAGKKLRCPECAYVFAPATPATPADIPTTKPGGAHAPAFEEQKEIFSFQKTDFDADIDQAREDVFRPLQERFERSLRGPALIQVVRPSDWLLRTGSAICVSGIVGILWAIWPLIFKIEVVQPLDKGKSFVRYAEQGDRRFKELTDDEFKERWIFLACFLAFFLWGTVVCLGASKMHTLESYPLAIVGSIMALLGPGVPWGIFLLIDAIKESDAYMMFVSGLLIAIPGVPMCMWCLATLRRQDVIDGFREEKPEVYVGDKVIQGDL